jgi:hypothetical protein
MFLNIVPEYSGKDGGPRRIMDALNRPRFGQTYRPIRSRIIASFLPSSPSPVTGMDDGWHRIE